MSLPRGSLAHCLGPPAAEPEQVRRMARRAWREHGLLLVRPDELNDNDERKTVTDVAERLYGKRRDDGA